MTDTKISPMMQQWFSCKEKARDAVLLFRLGDFYEAFFEDAKVLAKELDLTLTKRQETPMSGIPHHASESYIDRLLAKGYRVAIAEQKELASETKGLVAREVVRVLSPASIISSPFLQEKKNNFFVSLSFHHHLFGIAALDAATGELLITECADERELKEEIFRLAPKEILTSDVFYRTHQDFFEELKKELSVLFEKEAAWRFHFESAKDRFLKHFGAPSLDALGLSKNLAAALSGGALLGYLEDTLNLPCGHIQTFRCYAASSYMTIDKMSEQNLELLDSSKENGRSPTLFSVLDETLTPMGARLLRHWIQRPLLELNEIERRQDAISWFLTHRDDLKQTRNHLQSIKDLERLTSKITSGTPTPRDLLALSQSLPPVKDLKTLFEMKSSLPGLLKESSGLMEDLSDLSSLIERSLVEEPPLRPGEGPLFRKGICQELDELREISAESDAWMQNYQETLRGELGIKTLKVGFNRISGYFIEVSRGQSDRMPASFQRRQTLLHSERFLSPELKEFEKKILSADEKIRYLEEGLFRDLKKKVASYRDRIYQTSRNLSLMDCLQGLAETAAAKRYIRPILDDGPTIHIEEGRHPVIESLPGMNFVPNDLHLNAEERLQLITGPNMAGKSTYIRQAALLVLMAHIGSFIPAKKARIGLVDKIFTRIGASDDLAKGQSTFMVEMTETAHILHQATDRSLVILDEIGRGTSTYDGIAIARAVAEYLLHSPGRQAKTLFATHYLELSELEGKVPGAVNYTVEVKEIEGTITFLHKILRGSSERSFGVHVAELAGLPGPVIRRAKDLLARLEKEHPQKGSRRRSSFISPDQLSLF